eukprot:g457.t1
MVVSASLEEKFAAETAVAAADGPSRPPAPTISTRRSSISERKLSSVTSGLPHRPSLIRRSSTTRAHPVFSRRRSRVFLTELAQVMSEEEANDIAKKMALSKKKRSGARDVHYHEAEKIYEVALSRLDGVPDFDDGDDMQWEKRLLRAEILTGQAALKMSGQVDSDRDVAKVAELLEEARQLVVKPEQVAVGSDDDDDDDDHDHDHDDHDHDDHDHDDHDEGDDHDHDHDSEDYNNHHGGAHHHDPWAPARPDDKEARKLLATVAQVRGSAALCARDPGLALRHFRVARRLVAGSVGRNHKDFAAVLVNLAAIGSLDPRNHAAAAALLDKACAILEGSEQHQTLLYAVALRALATLEQLQGKWEDALGWDEQALELLSKRVGKHHPLHARCLQSMGESHMKLRAQKPRETHHLDSAVGYFERAVHHMEASDMVGARHYLYAEATRTLGRALIEKKMLTGALRNLRKAQAIVVALKGPEDEEAMQAVAEADEVHRLCGIHAQEKGNAAAAQGAAV